MSGSRRIAAVAVAAAVALAAFALDGRPAGKSGGARPLMLHLLASGGPGTAQARLAARFSTQIQELSDGSMQAPLTLLPLRLPASTPVGTVERAVVTRTRRGEGAIAIVPVHALVAQGVHTLDALEAPFLVSSLEQVTRATAGPLSSALAAGLRRISLTPLALVPEGLARAFGYEKPLSTPADFTGVAVRAEMSWITRDLLRTLGARPLDLNSAGVDTVLRSGFDRGAEPLAAPRDEFPRRMVTAGNVVFYPEVDVIAVDRGTYEGLTPAQQGILREAAREVRRVSIAAAGEGASAALFCRLGGTVVDVRPTALRSLERRAAPVLAELRRDPATRALLARLGRLARGRSGVASCVPPAEPGDGGPRVLALPPDGSYRRSFAVARLRAAGAGAADVRANSGVVTLTFSHGRFAIEWQSPPRSPCRGRAHLIDGLVQLAWDPGTPCSGYTAFAWRRKGRDLELAALDPRAERWVVVAYAGLWRRVY